METFLIRALQLIASLSILVILHEFGHFFFARFFKVRVDKYYVFFNPKISLMRWKKIAGKWQFRFFAPNVSANARPKKDADGVEMKDKKGKPVLEQIPLSEFQENDWRKYPETTEWGIGWVPLGGYCKIAGMIDESMDTAALAAEPQPWEFRSQKVWKRFLIIAGGVLVNFILALLIYSAVLFTWGKEYIAPENATYGYQFSQTMIDAGFQNGDKILKINGQKLENQGEIVEQILIDGNRNVIVERNEQNIELTLPEDLVKKILASGDNRIITLRQPFVIKDIVKASAAEKAKLQKGDSVVAINEKQMFVFQEISNALSENKDKATQIDFYRNNQLCRATVTPDKNGKLGVSVKTAFDFLKITKQTFGFFESIPAGISYGWETLSGYVKQLKLVFSKEGAQQLGGFGAIGSLFPPAWDWQAFWSLTAFLSIILAFMNFLPIPGLDGGYALFLIYEAITGRKPSDKFMERATTVGFVLLVALLLYANGNDVFKWIFK
jgi:regulator of sigma E protease